MKYKVSQTKTAGLWYCHMEGFPYIPVFGSIGSKKKAMLVCKQKNACIIKKVKN